MENVPTQLCNLKEEEEIMTEIENELDIEGQEENLNNLDSFR